ncbi:MAG: trypsin-like serine protease [Bauldia sp.]|nr:trypsin-like serine protease [Bauldia sp.]
MIFATRFFGLLGGLAGAASVAVAFAAWPVAGTPGASEAAVKRPMFAQGRFGNLLERISPPGKNPSSAAYTGEDTCRWANDGECDDPGIGTGACQQGTDYSDCWRIATGREDNSCEWANDGECDEPQFGYSVCTQGTDRNDCGAVAHLRFQTDLCELAFDGVCNEPGTGDGQCEVRTDRADCIGRDRPMEIRDHFFGHDDRQLLDTAETPWSLIGQLVDPDGGSCTATLIGEDILVSAAHCVEYETRVDARATFITGIGLRNGPEEAEVVSYFLSPNREDDRKKEEAASSDWVLLRIDRPLGRELGFVAPRTLDARAALDWEIRQAGFSWDTGDHLSGHLGCHIIEVEDENTIVHNCDTTEGDSGSPIMAFIDGEYFVIGTDSTFRTENGAEVNVAVRSDEWIGYLPDFRAGLIGQPARPAKVIK